MEIQEIKIDQLAFAEYNPREITDHDYTSLKNSIKEFGFVEPVIVNKNMEIIGGHMRVKAAKEMGLETVPCYMVDLTPEKAKLLNLALNRINGKWDVQKLGELIVDLNTQGIDLNLSGFEGWEIDYYNVGPEERKDNIFPKKSDKEETAPAGKSIVVFVFNNEDEANKCSAYFNDGIPSKTINGTKLLDLIGI